MRIQKVAANNVQIPQYSAPPTLLRVLLDPTAPVICSLRTVRLQPREWDGKAVMAAYDQETDTLFIKDD